MSDLVANVAARVGETQQREHALAVRAMFDRISPTYDKLNRTLSWGIDQRWRKKAIACLGELPAGSILDLCAGTLDLSQALEAHYIDRTIVAGDFAQAMLRAGRHKVSARTALHALDAQHLPYQDASFAGVICGFGLRNMAEPLRGLQEMRRVLKPRGRLVILEFFRPTTVWTRFFHTVYGRLVLPSCGRLVSGDEEAYGYLSKSMLGFWTRTECEQALSEVGFTRVQGINLTGAIASIVVGTL